MTIQQKISSLIIEATEEPNGGKFWPSNECEKKIACAIDAAFKEGIMHALYFLDMVDFREVANAQRITDTTITEAFKRMKKGN